MITSDSAPIHFFTRNYGMFNVYKLFELTKNLPVVEMDISEFEHMFNYKLWDGIDNVWLTYNQFTAFDLMSGTIKCREHFERIMSADLNYPVMVVESDKIPKPKKTDVEYYKELFYNNDAKYDVVDGMHRLCKVKMMKESKIKCVLLSWDILEKARIGGFWSYVFFKESNKISRDKRGSYVLSNYSIDL